MPSLVIPHHETPKVSLNVYHTWLTLQLDCFIYNWALLGSHFTVSNHDRGCSSARAEPAYLSVGLLKNPELLPGA